MAYIQGEARGQQALFPTTLDELIPADHVCRVIEAFEAKLDVAALGFVRAEPAETGRPGYDPRDLLKLYLSRYLQQVRSSRRLEAECRRNVEVIWLLGRLTPDYKSIAEFRRVHRDAVTAAGVELVRMVRQVGLVKGEWVAIDGSKFRAVSSAQAVREREAVKGYLDELENADQQDEVIIDEGAVTAALEKLKNNPEPEARFMRMGAREYGSRLQRPDCGRCQAPHYRGAAGHNRSQRSTQYAADGRSGEAIAAMPKHSTWSPTRVTRTASKRNAARLRAFVPHAPTNRAINNQGDGPLFDRRLFVYDEKTYTFCCPAGQTLVRKQLSRKERCVMYAAEARVCGACTMKNRCTSTSRR